MKLPRWIFFGLRNRAGRTSAPEADVRLRVENLTRKTTIATSLEVADTGPRRSKGLLGRDELEAGGGLWIIPCESVHTFGMRFAIDLIYLDRKHRVKKVKPGVPAWRLSACLSAHSILELPVGTIRASRTSRGDRLSLVPATERENSSAPALH